MTALDNAPALRTRTGRWSTRSAAPTRNRERDRPTRPASRRSATSAANAGLDTITDVPRPRGHGRAGEPQDPTSHGQDHVAAGADPRLTAATKSRASKPTPTARSRSCSCRPRPGTATPRSDRADGDDLARRGDRRARSKKPARRARSGSRASAARQTTVYRQGLGQRAGRRAADADGQALGQGHQRR